MSSVSYRVLDPILIQGTQGATLRSNVLRETRQKSAASAFVVPLHAQWHRRGVLVARSVSRIGRGFVLNKARFFGVA